jgi:predicted CXXCH cytochrome family protein
MRRLSFIIVTLLASAAAAQQSSIIHSPHNLSASGPGAIRASNEQEICIFCHTPHNAAPIQPLWNRNVPTNAYSVYASNSLQAVPGQPTGSSKLCLSCHDGTIALGSVLSRQQGIAMVGGITTLPPGASNLGTDLSDDHPISFRYDTTLVTRDTKLKPPGSIPRQVKLDHNSELQCTTCHEAHNNQFGKFLVMDNAQSQLCNSCHNTGHTSIAEHTNCNACHKPHTAPSGPYLLTGRTVGETCVSCHNGSSSPQGVNVAAVMQGFSKHDTNPAVTVKSNVPNDISCNDCHGSHTMSDLSALAPKISPRLGVVSGVNAVGATVTQAAYEFEVCFKCHAQQNSVQPLVSRQIVQNNKLLQFARSGVSYHPVEGPGRNVSNVPSLRPGLTTASMIYCSDCHGSDTAGFGGLNAKGPHGSNVRPLLKAGYSTLDNTSESADAYALCYSCHERTNILANQSFPLHSKHIVDARTPCSVCHDAHGISSAQGNATNNAHLINFDISVVQRDTVTGLLQYRSTGINSGTCTLTCHGVPHSPKAYGLGAANALGAPNTPAPARANPMRPSMPPPRIRPPRKN